MVSEILDEVMCVCVCVCVCARACVCVSTDLVREARYGRISFIKLGCINFKRKMLINVLWYLCKMTKSLNLRSKPCLIEKHCKVAVCCQFSAMSLIFLYFINSLLQRIFFFLWGGGGPFRTKKFVT